MLRIENLRKVPEITFQLRTQALKHQELHCVIGESKIAKAPNFFVRAVKIQS